MIYFDTFLLTLVATIFLTPLAKKVSILLGIYAVPADRKVHERLMPEFGGLAIFLALCLALWLAPLLPSAKLVAMELPIKSIWIAITAVFLLGAFDDKYNLSALLKLLVQLLIAFFLVYSGIAIKFLTNPFTGEMIFLDTFWSGLLTIGWIVLLINAINLIDGLDGLAAGITAISSFFLFVIALVKGEAGSAFLLISLLGTSVGFIRYNKWPASIFMGDSGSMLLGLTMAIASIEGVLKSSLTVALLIPLLSLLIPLYDLLFSVIRRLCKREHIFKADRGHVHHRLLKIGYNHSQVVIKICLVTFFFNVVALIMAVVNNVLVPFVFLLLAALILVNYHLFRNGS